MSQVFIQMNGNHSKGKLIIHPKSQGRGLMVSNYIDEHGRYLHLSPVEHEICNLS